MVKSSSNQPVRFTSLPSRPHPLLPQIDEHLTRLKSSNVTSTSVSQLSSLSHKLSNLKDFYDSLDDLILLPLSQSKLTQSKCLDELLEGSLRLLDVCGIAMDALSQLKANIQEIQSSLRRRSNGELIMVDEINGYINMRKKTKLMIKRCLRDVKGMIKGLIASRGEKKKEGNLAMVDVLWEVQGVTTEVFESLLEVMSGSKGKTLRRRVSLPFIVMCKLKIYQNVAFDHKEEMVFFNEIEDVDSSLSSLIVSQKRRMCVGFTQAENLKGQMVRLDSSIQDLDEVLEGLFRCLVKNRATLLNVVSH